MVVEFEARFPGRCAAGDDVAVGDLVSYDADDNLVHVECRNRPSVDELTTRGKEVCPICFTTKPCFCT